MFVKCLRVVVLKLCYKQTLVYRANNLFSCLDSRAMTKKLLFIVYSSLRSLPWLKYIRCGIPVSEVMTFPPLKVQKLRYHCTSLSKEDLASL